jgi:hypothetical protein
MLRSFQTVSLGTRVNKGEKKGRSSFSETPAPLSVEER